MEGQRARALLLAVLLVMAPSGPAAASTSSSRIKVVVVLMMENRSFDHLLGWLGPQVDGLTGREFNLVNTSDPNSERVFVSDRAEYVDPDPGHSFNATAEQIFGGLSELHLAQDPPPMSGFAQQAETLIPGFSHRVMAAFRPSAIPVTAALATQFAVFDRWFSSIPGPTQPNRFFLHSATSHGAIANIIPDLLMGWAAPQRTIFDDVDAAGKSFGIYFHDVPSTLFFSRLRTLGHSRRFHWFEQFERDARAGTLPAYTVLEPRYFDLFGWPANDDHPSHDLSEGQFLLKKVYEALRASPQWNETLLVVTYDEHGGFFDHVATPTKHVPSPDGIQGKGNGFQFNRLGVRVPTILVSPWINPQVVHEAEGPAEGSQYEHSSIPASVRKILGLSQTPLTRREAWAGTFDWLLEQRDTPRSDCPEKMPAPSRPLRHSPPNEDALLTEWQQELVQMSTTLGYNDSSPSTEAQAPVRASVRRRLAGTAHMTVKQGSDIARRAVTTFLHLRD